MEQPGARMFWSDNLGCRLQRVKFGILGFGVGPDAAPALCSVFALLVSVVR